MSSIIVIQPTGDAREVYCCYGDGETARTVRLLPTPEPSLQDDDEYINQRPIIAVVKKGRYIYISNVYTLYVYIYCICSYTCIIHSLANVTKCVCVSSLTSEVLLAVCLIQHYNYCRYGQPTMTHLLRNFSSRENQSSVSIATNV